MLHVLGFYGCLKFFAFPVLQLFYSDLGFQARLEIVF